MTPQTTLHEKFAAAFNAGDLAAMTALLSPTATAQVIGAEFPEEVGPEVVSRTSFAYLLEFGDDPMVAEAWGGGGDGVPYVLLREAGGDRALDTAIRLITLDGQIIRVEYLVLPHRPAEVQAIARAAGIPVRDE